MAKEVDEAKALRNEARYWRNDLQEKLKKPNAKRRFQQFLEQVIEITDIEIDPLWDFQTPW